MAPELSAVITTRPVQRFHGIRTRNPEMLEVLNRIKRFALTNAPVLIQGETGTGKELVARAIHAASDRRNRPLVVVDCGAIPESLIESELFGHERGSFTGADRHYGGRLQMADKATVFLDEINAVSLPLQAKLLRFLETGEFCRVGQQRPVPLDVRVISATNVPLENLVASGRMRSDFYYRLNVLRIHVPPLRLRRDDIPLLIEQFVEGDPMLQGCGLNRVSDFVMRNLCSQGWPGNVRELRNVLRESAVLGIDDGELRRLSKTDRGAPSPPGVADLNLPFRSWMLEREREYLRQLVDRCCSVAQQVAVSGLPARTLYRKIRRLRATLERHRVENGGGARATDGSAVNT